MTTVIPSFRKAFMQICLLLVTSCTATGTSSEMTLVGSTPGDESVKSMLSIPADTKVDFIRWKLDMESNNSFQLEISYGEAQPNTLGFKGGGQSRHIKGTYLIAKSDEASRFREVYHFKSETLGEIIALVKINENVFHLLTSNHQLMIGNGGWSYSLHREKPVEPGRILISSPVKADNSVQLVFEGRTPCREIAAEHPEMKAAPSCFKLKWGLVLIRDSLTYLPAGCVIRNIVDNQPRDISGKWEIIQGGPANPGVLIYKIVVDNLADPILLLIGDENVLFFLNRNGEPLPGNKDFGFALNKKI